MLRGRRDNLVFWSLFIRIRTREADRNVRNVNIRFTVFQLRLNTNPIGDTNGPFPFLE